MTTDIKYPPFNTGTTHTYIATRLQNRLWRSHELLCHVLLKQKHYQDSIRALMSALHLVTVIPRLALVTTVTDNYLRVVAVRAKDETHNNNNTDDDDDAELPPPLTR